MMVSEKKCYRECPAGYHKDETSGINTCKMCPLNCLTCLNQKFCHTCAPNFYMNLLNSLCESCDTQNGFYIDGDTCLPCYSRCETCFSPGKKGCLSCSPPSILSDYGTCRELPDPKIEIKQADYDSYSFIATVYFNQRLVKNNIVNSVTPILTQDGKEMNFTGEYDKLNFFGFTYKLNFNERVTNGTLTFINRDFFKIQSLLGEENYFFDNITIKGVNNDKESLKNAAEDMKTANKILVSILAGVSLIFSFTSAVALIKLFQIIEYYQYLNVIKPKVFIFVMEILSNNLLKNIPNYFLFLTDDNCRPLNQVFSDQKMECQFFQNTGPIFLILIAFLCLKFVLKMYSWRTTIHDRLWPYQKLFHSINKKFSSEFIFDLINMFQLDLYMAAAINIKSANFWSNSQIFNFIISIFAISILLFCNIFLFVATRKAEDTLYKLKKLKKEEIKDKKNKEALKEELEYNKKKRVGKNRAMRFGIWYTFKYLTERKDETSRYVKYYRPIVMMKDAIMAGWIVAFVDFPIIQVLGPCLLLVFYLFMECYHLPQIKIMDKIMEIFNLVFYNLLNLFFFINCTGIISDNDKREILIGWTTVFLILVLISVNSLYLLINNIIAIPSTIKSVYLIITCKTQTDRVSSSNKKSGGKPQSTKSNKTGEDDKSKKSDKKSTKSTNRNRNQVLPLIKGAIGYQESEIKSKEDEISKSRVDSIAAKKINKINKKDLGVSDDMQEKVGLDADSILEENNSLHLSTINSNKIKVRSQRNRKRTRKNIRGRSKLMIQRSDLLMSKPPSVFLDDSKAEINPSEFESIDSEVISD